MKKEQVLFRIPPEILKEFRDLAGAGRGRYSSASTCATEAIEIWIDLRKREKCSSLDSKQI